MAFAQPTAVVARLRELGRLIAAARRARGYTQVDLAARAGSSPATIKRVERGDARVAWGVVATVCWLLDLSTDPDAVEPETRASLLQTRNHRAHRRKKVADDF